jgi:hypothetical protein
MLSRSAPASSTHPDRSPHPSSGNSPQSPGAGGRCALRARPAFEFTARRGATTVPGIRHAVFATAQEPMGSSAVRFLRSRACRGDRSLWRHTLTTLGGKTRRPVVGGPGAGGSVTPSASRPPRPVATVGDPGATRPGNLCVRATPGAACSIGGPPRPGPPGSRLHRDTATAVPTNPHTNGVAWAQSPCEVAPVLPDS